MNLKEGFLLRAYDIGDGTLGLRPTVYRWTQQHIILIKFLKKAAAPSKTCSCSKKNLGLKEEADEKEWKAAALAACDKMGANLRSGLLTSLDRAFPGRLLPALQLQIYDNGWTSTATTDKGRANSKERIEIRAILMANHDISREDIDRVLKDKDKVVKVILEDSNSRWKNQEDKDQFIAFLEDALWQSSAYSHGVYDGFRHKYATRSGETAWDGHDVPFIKTESLTTYARVVRLCVCACVSY
jgi:hypothetical protein